MTENCSYTCEARDQNGNDASVHFDIYIENQLKAWVEGMDENVSTQYIDVESGESLDLRVDASADDADSLSYTWYLDHNEIEGNSEDHLTTDPITDYHIYNCDVRDHYGNIAQVWFYIRIKNHLIAWPDGLDQEESHSYIYVSKGESADLKINVSADDNSSIKYHWISDFEDLEDYNAQSLHIDSVMEVREYSCQVSDQYGNNKWVFFTIIPDTQLKAWPDGEDEDVQIKYMTVRPGESVDLKVNASAAENEPISYSWTYLGEEVGWSDSLRTVPIETYAEYSCNVSDQYGKYVTVWFYITPESAIKAWPDGEPEDVTYKEIQALPGESVELKVNASAPEDSTLTYAWYLDGNKVKGNYTDTLITDPIMGRQDYQCVVSDQNGDSATVDFYVGVENHLNAWQDGGEDNIYVPYGGTAEMKVIVSADKTDKVFFEWYRNNELVEDNYTDTLVIDSIAENQTCLCNVYDGYGNIASVYFSVHVENHLTVSPEGADGDMNTTDIYVSYDEPVELKVNVSADDTDSLTYFWYLDGEEIEGNNSDLLVTDSITGYREYQFKASDKYGNEAWAYFNVHVENHLKAWVDGQDEDTQGISYYVTPGESRELKVNVSAEDESVLSYTWYMNGEEIEGNNTDSLTTESITDYQEYKCDVSDQYGNTISVWFYISPESNLQAWPDGGEEWETEKTVYVPAGEPAELKVNVSAPEGTALSYSWYLDGDEIEGNNSTTLITEPVTEYGYYYFEVRDQYDNIASVYFHVYVENNLNAYVKGEDEDIQDISIGTPAKKPVDLEVVVDADDDSSLTYTWYLNDEEIEDANELVLHTDPIVESRNYKFRVQDQYGNEVSVNFYVYVENNLNAYPEGEDEDSIYKQYAVEYNESKDLKVIVTADDTSALSYTWYVSGEEIEGNNSDTLTTGPITENKGYEFVVRDQYGTERRVTFYVYIDNGLNAYPEGYDPDEDSIR